MPLRITDLKPRINCPAVHQLPKAGGLFKKTRRRLIVQPDEIAALRLGQEVRLLTTADGQALTKEIAGSTVILILPREFTLQMSFSNILFKNNLVGEVGLWCRARFLGMGKPNPQLFPRQSEFSRDELLDNLEKTVEKSLGSAFASVLAELEYHPGISPDQLQPLLDGPKIQRALQIFNRSSGVAIVGGLQAQAVSAPEIDALAKQQREADLDLLKRRRESESRIQEIAAQTAVQSAEARQEIVLSDMSLERERQRLKQEEMELHKKHLRAQADIQNDLAAQEVRKRKLENDLAEAQIAGIKTDIERIEADTREADRLHQYLLREQRQHDEMNARLEVIESKIAALKQPPEATDKQLGLVAEWTAYNQQGTLVPRLAETAELPTRAMLDVKVSVTRDAYVYILLRGSTGAWQCLVPDRAGVMGITRDNRQRANQVVIWPGENYKHQGGPPFWALDGDPGLERFIVVASLEKLDLKSLLADHELRCLRSMAKPTGCRGIVNPGEMDSYKESSAKPSGNYHALRTELFGRGCVMQETVITHI